MHILPPQSLFFGGSCPRCPPLLASMRLVGAPYSLRRSESNLAGECWPRVYSSMPNFTAIDVYYYITTVKPRKYYRFGNCCAPVSVQATHTLWPIGTKFTLPKYSHIIRLVAKFNLNPCIVSPQRGVKQIFTACSISTFCVGANYSGAGTKLNTGAQLQTFPKTCQMLCGWSKSAYNKSKMADGRHFEKLKNHFSVTLKIWQVDAYCICISTRLYRALKL